MSEWNKIVANKVYLYAPETMRIRRYYYISEKVGKTIKGIVITISGSTTTINNFEATKENVDEKTDLCTLSTYEYNKKTVIKLLFIWSLNSTLDIRI